MLSIEMGNYGEGTNLMDTSAESTIRLAGCLWGSAALDPAPKSSWKFEDAEMPSYDHIYPSPENGLYRCEEQGCRNREGFSQKGLLRQVLTTPSHLRSES